MCNKMKIEMLVISGVVLGLCHQASDAQTLQVADGLINGGIIAVDFRPNVTFWFPKSTYTDCTWNRNLDAEITFYVFASCVDNAIINPKNITCFENSTTVVATYKPLPVTIPENLTLTLVCSSAPTPDFYLQGKYCPYNVSIVGPAIQNTTYKYQSAGQFICPAGQQLFYNDSTPGITNTICQNDATWYGADGLECWAEPKPFINGSLTGIANSNISVQCVVKQQVHPPVKSYSLFIGGNKIFTQMTNQFVVEVQKEMNGQKIQCKAISNYSAFNKSLGFSDIRNLDVSFKPYKGTTTTNCIENQQCDIEVVSNPAPGNPFLVGPAMGSFTWTVQNHPYYTFQITKPKGTYMFRVNNSVGEGMFNVTVDAKTPISPSNLPLIIGASVAGVLVIAFVIILIVVIRRRNAGKSEQEERQNPIYGSSPNAVDNGTDYAQVQKKNKKNKKEMTENIAYQPASSPDAIEDAYASVSKNEKEVKMNILYGSSTGAHTSQVEDAYAEVDKGKKKKKDKTKAMKVNVAYVPTPENPDAPEEAYAEVNKDKKKKGKKGEKEMKDNILYGSSQAGGSVEDAYAEVDKKKKKNAGAKQGEGSSGATYSKVSKPKNKKKDKPSSSQTPDDDPYAEVDLHGQDSSNLD